VRLVRGKPQEISGLNRVLKKGVGGVAADTTPAFIFQQPVRAARIGGDRDLNIALDD